MNLVPRVFSFTNKNRENPRDEVAIEKGQQSMRIIQKNQQTFRFFLLDLWVLFSLSPCLEFLPELKLSSLSRESASDESFSEELFKMQPKTGVNELLQMMFDITVLRSLPLVFTDF